MIDSLLRVRMNTVFHFCPLLCTYFFGSYFLSIEAFLPGGLRRLRKLRIPRFTKPLLRVIIAVDNFWSDKTSCVCVWGDLLAGWPEHSKAFLSRVPWWGEHSDEEGAFESTMLL